MEGARWEGGPHAMFQAQQMPCYQPTLTEGPGFMCQPGVLAFLGQDSVGGGHGVAWRPMTTTARRARHPGMG
jgi:hypothetical protein